MNSLQIRHIKPFYLNLHKILKAFIFRRKKLEKSFFTYEKFKSCLKVLRIISKKKSNLEPCYHIHSSRLTTLNVNANDNDEKST